MDAGPFTQALLEQEHCLIKQFLFHMQKISRAIQRETSGIPSDFFQILLNIWNSRSR